jgi:protein-tyrosine kinase
LPQSDKTMEKKLTNSAGPERAIGEIIAEANSLGHEQVEAILKHQKQHGVKFGEAAVALGMIGKQDVLWALAQQFHYAYAQPSSGVISEELVVATNPFDESSECFRDLRAKAMQTLRQLGGQKVAIAVCSASSGDGKSYTAANLAVSFSQLGGRTILVDADLRNPRQHEIFNIDDGTVGAGVSGALAGHSSVNVLRPIPALPNLFVMPVGTVPPNPLELIQGSTFDTLISELLLKFEYVVVDSPAAAFGAYSRVIAGKCGSVIAVTHKGHTKAKDFAAFEKQMLSSGAEVIGVVLNDY